MSTPAHSETRIPVPKIKAMTAMSLSLFCLKEERARPLQRPANFWSKKSMNWYFKLPVYM